jgi:hypothetical protein
MNHLFLRICTKKIEDAKMIQKYVETREKYFKEVFVGKLAFLEHNNK